MKGIYIQDQEIFCFQNTYYHPKSEGYFKKYVSQLEKDECLIVLCPIKKVKDKNQVTHYKKINDDQIMYKNIPDVRKIGELPIVPKKLKKELKNADYCILRTGIAASIASYYCKKYHIKYMAVLCEDPFRNTIISNRMLVRATAIPLWIMTRYMVKNADCAYYVTNNYLQRMYPNTNFTLGCSDVETLHLDDETLERRKEKIKRPHHLIIGTAGAVTAYLKGHDIVIRALAILSKHGRADFKYQIVGKGDQTRLRNIAIEYGVQDQIEFIGELDRESVLKWMETIDIYIHPSRSEGLPRTIIEAMSRGTPCLASDVGGIPELLDRKYLFSPRGRKPEKKLAETIETLDANMLENAAIENYKKAREYCSDVTDTQFGEFMKTSLSILCDKEKKGE